mmetsp:Transcript_35678/g.85879  ORF Transcript_35678/g.85879 Transcript_35678/m.85879 type:complete len:325 (-) Transcript_35678:187-1161(-)
MSEQWSRPITKNDRVRCVAIVGGTHGNERNGVYLARHFLEAAGPAGPGRSYDLMVEEANTEAIRGNVRYTQRDLNRCFLIEDLANPSLKSNYEDSRAKELNQLLGPKTSSRPRCDYIFDLHNTTASTGVALMMHPRDTFSQGMAAYMVSIDPTVKIFMWGSNERPLLPTVGRSGMTFEVGPVAWGCMNAELFMQSKRLLEASMWYIEQHNQGLAGLGPTYNRFTLPAFRGAGSVGYPRNKKGDIAGIHHPHVQGKDLEVELTGDSPVFVMFDGKERQLREFSSASGVYPMFVNEAAYVEKDMAFMLCSKFALEVETLTIPRTTL